MVTYFTSDTIFDYKDFTTYRDLTLDDGNQEFFGGFFREYDAKDGTASWFRASKVFIRIMKKEINTPHFKGFCRMVSFSDEFFDRKMKHGRRYKVQNYMEIDDFEKFLKKQQIRIDKERRDRLVKEESEYQQSATLVSLNPDETILEDLDLEKVQKAFSATITTQDFDYLKNQNIKNDTTIKSMTHNELLEKWDDLQLNNRINELFQPGEFFRFENQLFQKLSTKSLGFKELGHVLLYDFNRLTWQQLYDILVQEGFSLIDFGDIAEFGRTSDKKEDSITITKKRRRKKRNNFIKDSEDYKDLNKKLSRLKLNYLINRNLTKVILSQVIKNKLIKKWFTVYLSRSNSKKFRIVYLPSGSGKTTLVNNFGEIFISMDELYNPFEKERMNVFFNENRVDFNKLNKLHRQKVALYRDVLIKDKIFLAHSPAQIPLELRSNAEEIVLIPDDYRKIRFFESNLRTLLKEDVPIVKVQRELYLYVIVLFFRLELDIVKKKYVRSKID